MPIHNPFVFGRSIYPEQFVGRQEEVQEIFSAIEVRNCVSITGERRMGKSSLLAFITSTSAWKDEKLDRENSWVISFDFQGCDHLTPSEFWHHMFDKFPEKLPDATLKQDLTRLKKNAASILLLERFFEKCSRLAHIIFVFDEFDLVALSPTFDRSFFDGLRLLSKYVTFIVASQQNLYTLYLAHKDQEKESLSSPFFNIFQRVPLYGFAKNDVDNLISFGLDGTGVEFNLSDREIIDFFGGRHPFFVQMTAHYIFASYVNGIDHRSRTTWISEKVNTNAKEHFHYYWQRSNEKERAILAALALIDSEELKKIKAYPTKSDPTVQQLLQRALLVENSGNFRIFSTLFQVWITDELSNIPLPNVEEIRAYIDKVQRKGFKQEWIVTTGTGTSSRFDWKSILGWLITAGGIGNILDWIQTLLAIAKK